MLRVKSDHPNHLLEPYDEADASLPNYRSIDYNPAKIAKYEDAYYGRDFWIEKYGEGGIPYLPPHPGETMAANPGGSSAYLARVRRSLYKNFFSASVDWFAGILTNYSLDEMAAKTLGDWQDDVDYCGNSFQTLVDELVKLCLRDGFSGMWVDFPINDGLDVHPILRAIPRDDLMNWYPKTGALQRVTIRRKEVVPTTGFGEEERTYYYTLFRDGWIKSEITDRDGVTVAVTIAEGSYDLGFVPLVVLSTKPTDPYKAESPFDNLIDINMRHYRMLTELHDSMYKVNFPAPVRTGLLQPGDYGNINMPAMAIGEHAVIDLPQGGTFGYAVPSGSAFAITQAEIASLEKSMQQIVLSYTDGTAAMTATEASLRSLAGKSKLEGLSVLIRSAVEQVLSYWSMWQGQPAYGGTINFGDLLQTEAAPDKVRILFEAVTTGLLSRETMLQQWSAMNFFAPGFDLEKELAMTSPDFVGNQQPDDADDNDHNNEEND